MAYYTINEMIAEDEALAKTIRDQANFVICPLDKAHTIREDGIQIHLCKCIKNFKGKKTTLKQCPFDSTHVMCVNELLEHVAACPSRGHFDRYKYNVGGDQVSANVPPPPVVADVGESWDNCDIPTYDKEKQLEDRQILRKKIGAKPAERKMFRVEQRQKFNPHQGPKEN